MPNGRCRIHGGKSTGPKTPEGRERIRQAKWKHGRRSAQGRKENKEFRDLYRSARKLASFIKKNRDSLTPDELEIKLKKLRRIEDKMGYVITNFKYPRIRDIIWGYKYFLKESNTFHTYAISTLRKLLDSSPKTE
jgi:hypothetical protein